LEPEVLEPLLVLEVETPAEATLFLVQLHQPEEVVAEKETERLVVQEAVGLGLPGLLVAQEPQTKVLQVVMVLVLALVEVAVLLLWV
jgi:hypothetical protein